MLQYFIFPVSGTSNSLKILKVDILGSYELFLEWNYIVSGIGLNNSIYLFSSVAQSCPTLWDSVTAACQASLSTTNFQSLLKLMSIETVMPSNHLILCRSLLLLPSILPSMRVFSNESHYTHTHTHTHTHMHIKHVTDSLCSTAEINITL